MSEKNELIHDFNLYEDIPSGEGRLQREMAVYELLHKLDIPFKRMDHEPMATIEACHGVDELLGIRMCKNLFLCNTQKTVFYLLMMPGEKKFKTKEISHQINSPRLSFAPPEYMERFLDITPGSVSVLGLMNDTENQVNLLVDEDVLKGEYIGCHPCINTSSLRFKISDLFEVFLKEVHHDYTIVTLTGEE